MSVRQRGASWQADVGLGGRRERATFPSEAEARAWERLASDALRRGKPAPKPEGGGEGYQTIEALYKTIVATSWGRMRGSHGQIAHGRRFIDFVGPSMPVGEALTQIHVDEWITDLIEEQQKAGGTVNRHLSAVSKMVKKALASGLIPRKLELPWQDEHEGRLRVFSEEEEALILQTFRYWSRPRHHDFLITLIETGSRTWTELGRLEWKDVVEVPCRGVVFWATKNGMSRLVPCSPDAWEAIQRQRIHGEAGPFRGICKDDSRRLWDRLRSHLPQIKDTVWYTARHTFASRLVSRGADLYTVGKLMGHKDPKQTQRYAKLSPKHLGDVVSLLPQRAYLKPVTQAVT